MWCHTWRRVNNERVQTPKREPASTWSFRTIPRTAGRPVVCGRALAYQPRRQTARPVPTEQHRAMLARVIVRFPTTVLAIVHMVSAPKEESAQSISSTTSRPIRDSKPAARTTGTGAAIQARVDRCKGAWRAQLNSASRQSSCAAPPTESRPTQDDEGARSDADRRPHASTNIAPNRTEPHRTAPNRANAYNAHYHPHHAKGVAPCGSVGGQLLSWWGCGTGWPWAEGESHWDGTSRKAGEGGPSQFSCKQACMHVWMDPGARMVQTNACETTPHADQPDLSRASARRQSMPPRATTSPSSVSSATNMSSPPDLYNGKGLESCETLQPTWAIATIYSNAPRLYMSCRASGAGLPLACANSHPGKQACLAQVRLVALTHAPPWFRTSGLDLDRNMQHPGRTLFLSSFSLARHG